MYLHTRVHTHTYTILIGVWLLWHVPRLHIAWDQVTAGLGFFLCSSYLSNCDDSDSLLHKA